MHSAQHFGKRRLWKYLLAVVQEGRKDWLLSHKTQKIKLFIKATTGRAQGSIFCPELSLNVRYSLRPQDVFLVKYAITYNFPRWHNLF